MLEIFLKFKIFDQPSPLKHEIWQNQEISFVLTILLKFKDFDHPGSAKRESFAQILRFLTTPVL